MAELQRQPTGTSCGATSIAILLGVPAADVLRLVPSVRTTARRRRMRVDRVNVGEVRRLLRRHGLAMGRRRRDWPPLSMWALVRMAHPTGRGWHWMACAHGDVLDPLADRPERAWRLGRRVARRRLSWYAVSVAR